MKSVLIVAALLVCSVCFANSKSGGDHYVLVYQDNINTEYQCTTFIRHYVDWTGYGNSFRSGCSVSDTYSHTWPLVYPIDTIRVEIDSTIFSACRYVAYVDLGTQGPETYLVVDCRTY